MPVQPTAQQPGMPPAYPKLTTARLDILILLEEYKCLSGKQIWQQLQPDKQYTHTLGELAALRKGGFIRACPFQRNTVGRSELAWNLLKPGAEAVGVTDFDNRYRRRPDRFLIAYRELELELARQVGACSGWRLLRPEHYNSSRPLPAITPQGKLILQTLGRAESRAIEETSRRDPNHPSLLQKRLDHLTGDYRSRVPYQANDHIAYQLLLPADVGDFNETNIDTGETDRGGISETAIIFILCPPRVNLQFWKSRIQHYSPLTRTSPYEIAATLPVYAVFEKVGAVENNLLRKFAAATIRPLALHQVSEVLFQYS